ncbi:sensor histidine kinase [Bacillus lacus]|uniref:histidine kinase n=1 Tax=Metabacillus lacus TaxID=1983721 RepID=A0A7X2IX39_9BACI|nr:sensor histidine kinase [Metabacillus lacus]MRX71214.1 sensor histidine kinase [Metabacillus lacus]
MVRVFIRERASWIIMFGLSMGLLLFISYLDPSIAPSSAFYIVFLQSLLFLFFLFYRYLKETAYYKSLQEWDESSDPAGMKAAERPFEKMFQQKLQEQTLYAKKTVRQNLHSLEQEKDELLSWVHEMKTPLTAMHLILDRLEDTHAQSQLKYEWLRVHMLLDQQLYSKRLKFIENDLYVEVTDLKSAVFTEIKDLQAWCLQRDLGFNVHLKDEKVLTDAKWLGFILRQILTNAVKYSRSSDIEITSSVKAGSTVLKIKDYGRGIDPKDLPRIFEKGFTSAASHGENSATGMGLYLAKKAADALLINLSIQSYPGKGTTVTLLFPAENEFTRISGM